MPLLPQHTLDGKVVDANYFKGHVTLVNFMYIGCPPCMNELNILNRLNKEYGGKGNFQMLCIARQMKSQMVDFNSEDGPLFSQVRKFFGAEPIAYDILPACDEGASKMISRNANGDTSLRLESECDVVEKIYRVDSYPTTFLVDRNGIIRKINHGGPATKSDEKFYMNLRVDIDSMLSQ